MRMEQKPIISRDNLIVDELIANSRPAADSISSTGQDTLRTGRGGDRPTKPIENKILFVGFESADEKELVAIYGSAETELTFSKGGTDDLLLLGLERFDAVAIQVDSCELYAPAIIEYLHTREVVNVGTEVVAVTGYLIPNFVDQLRSSGCTNVINVMTEYGEIFPGRTWPSVQRKNSA